MKRLHTILTALAVITMLLPSCSGKEDPVKPDTEQPDSPGEDDKKEEEDDKPGTEEPGGTEKPEEPEESEKTLDDFTSICESGTSNCYTISSEGSYRFNAAIRGNGKAVEGVDMEKALEGTSASLVWQTSENMIKDVILLEGQICFTATDIPGNAVIALTSDSGILWSWHIWHPEEAPKELKTKSGFTVMDMNLGAMSNGSGEGKTLESYGLLYQWGRKDPFPGSPSLTGDTGTLPVTVFDLGGKSVDITKSDWYSTENNTIEWAIANPTVVLSNYSQRIICRDWLDINATNDALWGNPEGTKVEEGEYVNKGTKTLFDPCPVGWRVPPPGVFRDATPSGGYETDPSGFNVVDTNADGKIDTGDFNCGWTICLNGKDVTSFFPATGRYDGTYAMLYGSVAGLWGNYWSNSPYSQGLGFSILSFQATTMSPSAGGGKADAYSIRCIKE
jgi:hypothetical protein